MIKPSGAQNRKNDDVRSRWETISNKRHAPDGIRTQPGQHRRIRTFPSIGNSLIHQAAIKHGNNVHYCWLPTNVTGPARQSGGFGGASKGECVDVVPLASLGHSGPLRLRCSALAAWQAHSHIRTD